MHSIILSGTILCCGDNDNLAIVVVNYFASIGLSDR